MPATSKANDPPAVSIIVPARNEELSLKICMDSLSRPSRYCLRDHRRRRSFHRPHPRDCVPHFQTAQVIPACVSLKPARSLRDGLARITPSLPELKLLAAGGCCSPMPTLFICRDRWREVSKKPNVTTRPCSPTPGANRGNFLGESGDARDLRRTGRELLPVASE